MITINYLCDIIKKHGGSNHYRASIDGCKLLEHIDDIEEFVSVLREGGEFVNDHPDPIEFILSDDVTFITYENVAIYIMVGSRVNGYTYYYKEPPTELFMKEGSEDDD